mmetsp:Transcript_7269/g.12660  ORF Transcript_7269/g.12660 Transcript_7269/m.12660 type:complete len:302 (+) Transcript_7269:870-1775(+)
MFHLKLEPSVEPIHPYGTVHIHGCPYLVSAEGLPIPTKLFRGHRKVRQSDLYVQNERSPVRHQNVCDQSRQIGQEGNKVHKPGPEDSKADDLPLSPQNFLFSCQQDETLRIKIEPRESHNGIIQKVLQGQENLAGFVELHDALMVGGIQTFEEFGRYSKNGHVLDVWIMLRMIRRHVMNVVRLFPPRHGDSAQNVAKEDSDHVVPNEGLRNPHVSCIVPNKGALVPECSVDECCKHVAPEIVWPVDDQSHEGSKHDRKSCHDAVVEFHITLEPTLRNNLIVKVQEFPVNAWVESVSMQLGL